MNSNLVALQTITLKECKRVLRIWMQTILPPGITITLYFLIFGSFLGKHIGTLNGVSYIDFITPGFIMMAAMTNTYSNISSSFFVRKLDRSIEDMLVAPVHHSTILWGYILGGVFRGLLIIIFVTLIAACFNTISIKHPFILLFTLFFSLFPLAIAGFINGMLAKKFDDVSLVPTFIITPLTYLGGVFYPINQLSPFWHHISLFNPIVYMVNLFRYSMLGSSDIHVGVCITVLLVLTITLHFLAYGLLKAGVGVKK